MRKDIENMHTILLAIKNVEGKKHASAKEWAEKLDSLYSALKCQCEAVVEIELRESIKTDTQH